MNIIERATAPTPRFFRILRSIGMALTAIAAAVIGVETMPEQITEIATYVATAGAAITAVSQVTVDEEALDEEREIH